MTEADFEPEFRPLRFWETHSKPSAKAKEAMLGSASHGWISITAFGTMLRDSLQTSVSLLRLFTEHGDVNLQF